ncbi:rna binding protein [Holotrichia oblita]|uniref:Rna binding protein n=1 Tax=Holotrichia oblita TaxID=644536 RepID=A0ACB9TTF3_HOLOL|nr:rna binding protein [Holotrichia oblita]
MSRIIVKNLPKTITEEKLRQIFSQKGLLTDVQLKYAPNGKFRQFAFVGYQNETDAHEAIKYFNNTCIQTNKIEVTPCVLLGDSSKPKSWSKYALDNNGSKKSEAKDKTDGGIKTNTSNEVKDKTDQLLDKYKDDPLFEEFMEAHGVKTNSEQLSAGKNEIDKDDSGVSDGESSAKEEAEKPDEVTDLEVSILQVVIDIGIQLPNFKHHKQQQISVHTIYANAHEGHSRQTKTKNAEKVKEKINLYTLKVKVIYIYRFRKMDILECKKNLHVFNHRLFGSLTSQLILRQLRLFFSSNISVPQFFFLGPLAEVNLPIDTTTRKFKGFGIVTFVMPEHAVKAYTELDGSILQGRMLHLLPGMAKDSGPGLEDDDSTNYKRKKEKKQKSEAALSHNWNSLFLGQDAVAEIIADTYGTTKKAVLDPYGDSNTAVRLALGETQIIANTRKYLEQEGVVLDAFDKPTVRRSKTIILVKNLPANTKTKELHEIFKPHGVIGRIILPPNAVTAIVEFIEPSEARKAFTRLAYSKFKNLPLYLEWAPENSLSVKNETVHNKDNVDEVAETKSDLPSTELNQEELDNDESETPEPDTTLFVKNLNFETTDNVLKKHFESCGKVYYATVATKKDKNDPSKRLSMGYGFVQFMYKSGINKALKMLQQSDLDGKSLELKRSERTLANQVNTTRKPSKKTKQTGTKILVRNVPFQATLKEIRELFKYVYCNKSTLIDFF